MGAAMSGEAIAAVGERRRLRLVGRDFRRAPEQDWMNSGVATGWMPGLD